jgi:hypothetical protein
MTISTIHQDMLNILYNLSTSNDLTQARLDHYWHQLNRLQCLNQVDIDTVHFNGKLDPLDEFVAVRNRSPMLADISGWRIQAGSPRQKYTFPPKTYLAPDTSLSVHTSGDHEHSFDSRRPIWNNYGDTATLYTTQGQLVSSLVYGNQAHPHIHISYIHFDGQEFRTEGDEYIEISNTSEHIIELGGWHLDILRSGRSFTFDNGVQLTAHASLKVFTNKAELKRNEYSFDSPTALWNNQQGGCKLLDYQDREVFSYFY